MDEKLVVVNGELTRTGPGTELTEDTQKKLLTLCRRNSIKDVRDLLGIKKGTYDGWVHKAKQGKEPYASFYIRLQKSKAARRTRLAGKIERAKDWKAWAWLLSKLDPVQYGDNTMSTEEAMRFMWECVSEVCTREQLAQIVEIMNDRREGN